jgi:hypothetical protein
MNKKKITIVASALFLSPLGAMENATNGTSVVPGISGNGLQSAPHNYNHQQSSLHPSSISAQNSTIPGKHNLSLTQTLEDACQQELCRQEEAAYRTIQEQKRFHNEAEQSAERIRDCIDGGILNINTGGWLRRPAGYYYSSEELKSLTNPEDCVKKLETIGFYISSAMQDNRQADKPEMQELVLNKLVEKHTLFKGIINRLADERLNLLQRIDGNSIDEVYGNPCQIFPVPPLLQSFIHKKALEKYANQNALGNSVAHASFLQGENEIHYTLLFGHKHASDFFNLSRDQLLMSSDGKYIRALLADGHKIFWNMKTGQQVTINDTLLTWQRYDEDDHHCKAQRVVDPSKRYLVTPGVALMYGPHGVHAIEHRIRQEYDFPVLMLFQNPTIESSLCVDAFKNSKGKLGALRALKNSCLIKKIDGFPAIKLNELIDKELQNIQSKL